jgi:hypothetical protein
MLAGPSSQVDRVLFKEKGRSSSEELIAVKRLQQGEASPRRLDQQQSAPAGISLFNDYL